MAGFKESNPGCCCEDTGAVNVTVMGCGIAQVGVTVTCTETSDTDVTDGSGVASFTALADGTYHFTVPASTGFNAGSGTATVSGGGTTNVTITLTVATGYSCAVDCGCDDSDYESGPPYLSNPAPNTLYVDDGFGTVTLTKSGNQWLGGPVTRVASEAYTYCGFPWTTVADQDVDVSFVAECVPVGAVNTWQVSVLGNSCSSIGRNYPASASSGASQGQYVLVDMPGTCNPFARSGSGSFTSSNEGYYIYGSSIALTLVE